jgi:hypothetical protein
MTIAMSSKPRIKRSFERYDWRLGCLAIRKDEHWWVSIPNGDGIRCASEEEARNVAQFINLTATDEEKEEWRI